jgi:Domain of unknown function (DUF543)
MTTEPLRCRWIELSGKCSSAWNWSVLTSHAPLARSLSAFLSSHVSVSIVEQSIVACDTMPASELKIADKWDYAIETGIKRTVYGTVAAGVVAVLLFRKFN